ncbi:MAG: hypothetical protein JWO82_1775 [Akkermansiaceae bacterium]|nr:hypothetical protein [Akkermansiaceae bacterium]
MSNMKPERGAMLRAISGAAVIFGGAVSPLLAADPSWWRQDDTVVITSAAPNNYGPVTVGQAKHMAKSALTALRKVAPQVANAVEADLVGTGKPIPTWVAPAPGSDLAKAQSAALLAGQLKAIAAPFYERLHGYAPAWLDLRLQAAGTYTSGSYFPWTAAAADDANYAIATIGQLKAVFALDFALDSEMDDDCDGIPDLWEYAVIHADTTGTWTAINQITLLNAATIGLTSPAGAPPHTLSLHSSAQVDNRIAGKAATNSLAMFVNYQANGAAGTFVRNTDFWAADMAQELTCMSPWNTMDSSRRAGTLVTPRHMLVAHHFFLNPGTVVTFVTAGNVPVTRTVVNSMMVPNTINVPVQGTSTDLDMVLLDADLPPSITPCLVPPANLAQYIPRHDFIPGSYRTPLIAGMGLNQEEEGFVNQFYVVSDGLTGFQPPNATAFPKRAEFNKLVILYDSGNPSFLLVNNKLMLMTLWHTNPFGGGAGDGVWNRTASFNSTIAALDAAAGITGGTGYTVTEMDLSEFLKF